MEDLIYVKKRGYMRPTKNRIGHNISVIGNKEQVSFAKNKILPKKRNKYLKRKN